MRSDQEINGVIEWLQEGLRHIDYRSGNDVLLVLAQKLLLLEGSKLGLLQFGLSPLLFEDALILAARSIDFVVLNGVKV